MAGIGSHLLGKTATVWTPNLRDVPLNTSGIITRVTQPAWLTWENKPSLQVTITTVDGRTITLDEELYSIGKNLPNA